MSTPLREQLHQMVAQVEAFGDVDRAIAEGVRRRNRSLVVATAVGVTAVLVLAAVILSNPLRTAAPQPVQPGPTVDPTITLAAGEGVELVGNANSGLGGQTVSVSAKEQGGQVTGEFRISNNVMRVDCARTDSGGIVIIGGEATKGPDVTAGDLLALIIREGKPDSVSLYGNNSGASSCAELIGSIPAGLLHDDSNFVDVEDGYDIVTD